MQPNRNAKSHATAWLLAVVAVPVLYVLSASPIYYLATAGGISKERSWLTNYLVAARWIVRVNPTLHSMAMKYDDFWCEITP